MNPDDARLWKSGRAKVEAGRALTAREREVLQHYGGDAMLTRGEVSAVVTTKIQERRATKRRGKLETTSLTTDKLLFCDLRHGIVRRTDHE